MAVDRLVRRNPMLDPKRIAAAGALALFLVGLGVAVSSGLGGEDAPSTDTTPVVTSANPTPRAPARPRPAPFVELTAAGAFDPEGDERERDDEAGLAVDGRLETAWRTERYSSFFKSGVGLVLDAGRRVRVEQVVLDSPTPGIRAEIRLGDSPDGPFKRASATKTLKARTTFPVARRPGRYVVVWIVRLPPSSAGEVAEVRVRGR